MTKPKTRLMRLLARLDDAPSPARRRRYDTWQRILLENIAYLADDDARETAFDALQRLTKCDPAAIATCADDDLHAICAAGRMPENQMAKLRECAAVFAMHGDPRELVQLPRPAAKKALARFPGIGEPGIDMLRLLAGVEPVLALDSNALRVLLRLGYGEETKAYAKSHRSAQAAATAELPASIEVLTDAYHRLRSHGKYLCRRSRPQCGECALRADCPSAIAAAT